MHLTTSTAVSLRPRARPDSEAPDAGLQRSVDGRVTLPAGWACQMPSGRCVKAAGVYESPRWQEACPAARLILARRAVRLGSLQIAIGDG